MHLLQMRVPTHRIELLEHAPGEKAKRNLMESQAGDVPETFDSIDATFSHREKLPESFPRKKFMQSAISSINVIPRNTTL